MNDSSKSTDIYRCELVDVLLLADPYVEPDECENARWQLANIIPSLPRVRCAQVWYIEQLQTCLIGALGRDEGDHGDCPSEPKNLTSDHATRKVVLHHGKYVTFYEQSHITQPKYVLRRDIDRL